MDLQWLYSLDQQTVVIVPTRSLAISLQEEVALHHVSNNNLVWETPSIMVWQDYLQLLWQQNRTNQQLLNNRQSLLLWQQVIKKSRYQERQYALLNVQQTANAAQRSWQLINDWQISVALLQQQPDVDTQQFIKWLTAYNNWLQQKQLIDEAGMGQLLKENAAEDFYYPFQTIIWYASDVKTVLQKQFDNLAQQQGVKVEDKQPMNRPTTKHFKFSTVEDEWVACLQHARKEIEQNGEIKIALVVPELKKNKQQLVTLARQVFYPDEPPAKVDSINCAFRFSLGNSIDQWPMTASALNLLQLLKNNFTTAQIGGLLHNQYLSCVRNKPLSCIALEQSLRQQKQRYLSISKLKLQWQQLNSNDEPSSLTPMFDQLDDFLTQLDHQRFENKHRTLRFEQWVALFQQWLAIWGWGAEDTDSNHFQLHGRWLKLLKEFRNLSLVQSQVGLDRALEILLQLARDAVFLPKAPSSPLVISGIYDAVGRSVDLCLLTGMSEDYPAMNSHDAFIPNYLLIDALHPQANARNNYALTEKIINNLSASTAQIQVSYAQRADARQETMMSSPLFANKEFDLAQAKKPQQQSSQLHTYEDVQGQPWIDKRAPKSGVRILEDQSNCAFKAYATHQLAFDRTVDDEFGLDVLQRGNIVHALLEFVWQKLKIQQALPSVNELASCASQIVSAFLPTQQSKYDEDTYSLLLLEQQRLSNLLAEWLYLEKQRPTPFSVVETEQRYSGQIGNLPFSFIIDRLDQLEDGRQLIVDYKTGNAARKDWLGERIKKPQLPLYALTLAANASKQIDGITYAISKRHQCKYEGLSQSGMLNYKHAKQESGLAELWRERQAEWQTQLEALAEDFLSAEAPVNPIEEATCQYCELHSLCRVAQLKKQNQELGA